MLPVLQRGPKLRKLVEQSNPVPDYVDVMQFHPLGAFSCFKNNFAYPGKK